MNYKRAADIQQKTQYGGNNKKSMRISVEDSLKKLRTSYIDILYVHWVSLHHYMLALSKYQADAALTSGTGIPVWKRLWTGFITLSLTRRCSTWYAVSVFPHPFLLTCRADYRVSRTLRHGWS